MTPVNQFVLAWTLPCEAFQPSKGLVVEKFKRRSKSS